MFMIVMITYLFGTVVTTALMMIVMRGLFPQTYPVWKCLVLGLAWPMTWFCEVFGVDNALLW